MVGAMKAADFENEHLLLGLGHAIFASAKPKIQRRVRTSLHFVPDVGNSYLWKFYT
jgi:hypothetical protein